MAGRAVFLFLGFRQQIKEQGANPVRAQRPGNELIPRAVPAAAAAMSKEHNSQSVGRDQQFTVQLETLKGDDYFGFHFLK